MGRTAYGVRGIQLREGDEVVAMEVVKPGGTLLTVTEKGYAKRTDLDEYRVQSRGGLGLKNLEITDKNGPVVGIAQVHENEELLVITQQGKILRTPANRHPHHRPRHAGRAPDGSRSDGRQRRLGRACRKTEEEVLTTRRSCRSPRSRQANPARRAGVTSHRLPAGGHDGHVAFARYAEGHARSCCRWRSSPPPARGRPSSRC